jgi:pilus assembly protein CpaE
MGYAARFIILNSDEQFRKELRAALLTFDGVKVVAEVEEMALVGQAVEQIAADILLVNLDPNPEAVLPMAGGIATAYPNLAVFAVSASADSGLILRALRTGLREFLPRPIDLTALGEAIQRVASAHAGQETRGRVITVTGSSGGIGATMFATNLAVELAAIVSGRVTVVDLDYRFGQVATHLDIDAPYSIADLVNTPEQLEQQVIERALVRHSSGVWVLSRPNQFELADSITGSSCVGLLSSLSQFNEYVVTDGPLRGDIGGQAILDFADLNFLLVQLLVPSVRSALRLVDSMRESGANLERVQLISNRLGQDSVHLSIKDVTTTLNLRHFATMPDDWSTVSGAINLGEPLMTHAPKSKVRQAIQSIAEQLHEATEDDEERKESAKKGLMGRLFAGA